MDACTFAENEAFTAGLAPGMGGGIATSGKALVSNSTLTDNVGDLGGATDLEGQDPQLEELADNGGPTPTMALGAESPARDVIPPELCLDLDGEPLTVDQTGRSRPVGEGCDIGAYEHR